MAFFWQNPMASFKRSRNAVEWDRATKAEAQRWMHAHLDDYFDSSTGMVDTARLATGAAHAVGDPAWARDASHPIHWEAVRVALSDPRVRQVA